jgi:AraC-like DNA-binding protein
VRRSGFPGTGREPSLHPAHSVESYIADPVGSYIKGRTFAVFWAHEDLNGLVFWGRPDESDVEIVTRALETELSPRVHPHASIVDLRHLEALDLWAFERLSSYWASRSDQLSRLVTRRALLVRDGAMAPSLMAFYSALSPDLRVHSFADPLAALNWIGVRRMTVLGEIERLRGGTSTDSALLGAVRGRLDEDSAIKLDDLARRVGISTRTLQRRLRDLGTSFQDEATSARLRLARRLLRETDHAIKWIAIECGCASLQHFSGFFREHEGMSPSRWRIERGMDGRASRGVIL